MERGVLGLMEFLEARTCGMVLLNKIQKALGLKAGRER